MQPPWYFYAVLVSAVTAVFVTGTRLALGEYPPLWASASVAGVAAAGCFAGAFAALLTRQ